MNMRNVVISFVPSPAGDGKIIVDGGFIVMVIVIEIG